MRKHRKTSTTVPGRQGRSSPHHGMRGFAMMDVAFGAAILGIIVMGTLQIFQFGQRQITTRVAERSAYDLASTRIEEVIAEGFDLVTDRVDTGLTVTGNIPATRTTTISWIDDPADSTGIGDPDGPEDFKNVAVVVAFGPDGSQKSVTISTVLIP